MRLQRLLIFTLAAASVTAQALTTNEVTATFGDSPLCYDQARQRLSVFEPGRVTEWDGTRWARLAVAAPALTSPVWSTTHNRIVALADPDVVAFDGHSFETLTSVPGGAPFGRLIADTQTGELVVLVADALNGSRHYRWNGTSWRQLASTPGQGTLVSHGYDEARGVVVVEHARILGGIAYETYEWDGSAWVLRATSNRAHSNMAFDHGLQRIVASYPPPSFTWDGSGWTQLTSGQDEPTVAAVTTGPLTGGTFGRRRNVGADRSEIVRRDQQTWSELRPNHAVTIAPRFTFDSARGRAVLVDQQSHYEFDGDNWHRVAGSPAGPFGRIAPGQVYDAARQQTVVFGGFALPAGHLGDTWLWDGTTWSQVNVTGPPARRNATMTYDSARQRVLMLGGLDYSRSPANFTDHWEWDGSNWLLISANVPMATERCAIGYDPLLDRTVGVDDDGNTWEYDGQSWRGVATARAVTPVSPDLFWNGQRDQLQSTLRDAQGALRTMAWDGRDWNEIGRNVDLLAYDPNHDVVLGYDTGSTRLTVTTATPAAIDRYGSPCGGSTTRTSLTAFGRARPGTSALHLDLRAEATLRPVFYLLGTGRTQVALGSGCKLLIRNPIATVLSFTDAFGVRQLQLPILDDAGLLGIAVTAQAAVLDPASPGGLAMTQGLELTVGN